jgi:menaquinone-dependent protoporphyrinogen oxidase
MSRRGFLTCAGIALGASAVVCSGLGYVASQLSPAVQIPQAETPSFQFGKVNSAKKRILVAYATRTGSTVGVAAAIGETLGSRDFSVEVKPFNENPSIEGYQAVALGSAVNGGQWLPEAVDFVKNHQQVLQQIPVVLFSVHIMNLGDDEKSKDNRKAYLNAVRPLFHPVDEVFFAGMGSDPEKQSELIRWVYRTFKIGPEGDCRDWEKIRTWSETVFS